MKIFSAFCLLAGVSFGMPMANQDRDSSDTKMEEFMKLFQQVNEATIKILEESNQIIEDENRKSANLFKQHRDLMNSIIERYDN